MRNRPVVVRLARVVIVASLVALAVTLVTPVSPQEAMAAVASAPVHPRLLFLAEDLPALRDQIAAGGVHGAAYRELLNQAEGHLLAVQPDIVRANIGLDGGANGLEKPYALQNEMMTYLMNLGLAYQLSGDERFGRHAIELLSALGDADYPYWCCQDLGIGDLDTGLALGFDWTYQLMTEAERAKIIGDLAAHEDKLLDRMAFNPTHPASRYVTSNWVGVTAGGSGLLALALRGEPGAPARTEEYLVASHDLVRQYFEEGWDPLGANLEGHTYAGYGLKNAGPYALAAIREGLSDLISNTGLPNQARWLTFEQLPGDGQNFVPLNDSGRTGGGVGMPAFQFAIDPDNGVAQWHWRRTVGDLGNDYYNTQPAPDILLEGKCEQLLVGRNLESPLSAGACPIFHGADNVYALLYYRTPEQTPEIDPATTGPLSMFYEVRGLVDARTGFANGSDEVISTFEAHRNGEGHFQYDVGNFTLYGKGGRFAIDPGTSCVACGNNDDAGFAIAHNVIVIDGAKETQDRFLRYFLGTTIDDHVNTPTFSLTHADLRYAYDFEAPIADRDHFFGRRPGAPVIVAIGDSVQRDKVPFEKARPNDHTYTWQMLTQYENLVTVDGPRFEVVAPNGTTLVGRAATVDAAGAEPVFEQRFYAFTHTSDDLPGAHVVSTTTAPTQRFDQLTVLALTGPDDEPATTATLAVEGGVAVAVDHGGERDVFVRRLALARAVTGVVATDATMAKYAVGLGDTIVRGGTHLVADGRSYVNVLGTSATVAVSGDEVIADGPDGNRYRVFAPQPIREVMVNERAVGSCRNGDFLEFPCPSTATTSVDAAAADLPVTGGSASAIAACLLLVLAFLARPRGWRPTPVGGCT